MADYEEDRASGDAGEQIKREESLEPEPEPPKLPDVELVVDGFGFMPKATQQGQGQGGRTRNTSVFEKSKQSLQENTTTPGPEGSRSPCASSTNIDIVRRYTWNTKNRMTVQIITYGATITCIQVPDKRGSPDDVIAGFDTLEEYLHPRNPYFGATIGRYANIICEATMVVRPSGRTYMLSRNKGHHHYHGGHVGFDKVNWRSHVNGNQVIMSHVSERFEEGYPGAVLAQIAFEVTCDNTINIEMKCTTNEPTIVNLTSAPYFNLAGHHAGTEAMFDHIVTINADKYTATDEDGLVTGEKKIVGGTAFDFRVPRILRTMMPRIPMGGYDVNFCITQGTAQDLTFQARVLHPTTGRVLEVYSNQPGLQLYTGNLLPDPDKILEAQGEAEEEEEEEKPEPRGHQEVNSEESRGESESENSSVRDIRDEETIEEGSEGKVGYGYVPLLGKQGALYKKHGLFCLMPQNYPDAVNHRNFPNSVLNPGEVYIHRIQYKFGILLGRYI